MFEEALKELKSLLGDGFSTSLTDRFSHSADFGYIPMMVWYRGPNSLKRLNTIPDGVAYPQSDEEVQAIVKIAYKYKVPIVPYGRGTNRYGNAVPVEGGIVIDSSYMKKVGPVDEKNRVIIAEAGATWKDVDVEAQRFGLQLRTFPSSIDSTVGGGIAGDALGLGSYEWGFISDNLSFVEIVNPRGVKEKLTGDNIARVAGAEGTTGLILRAGIMLRQFSPTKAITLAVPSFEEALNAIESVYSIVIPAWHIQVRGPSISRVLQERWRAPVEADYWNIIILYPDNRSKLIEPKIQELQRKIGAKTITGSWIGWWSFNHGVVAALREEGPLIHQHGLIRYNNLPKLVESLRGVIGNLGDIKAGFDLDIDLEKRYTLLVNIFTIAEGDVLEKRFILSLGKNTILGGALLQSGGSLLSVGMFLQEYAEGRLRLGKFEERGVNRYEVIKKYKESEDPEELMNPGKLLPPVKRGLGVEEIKALQSFAKSNFLQRLAKFYGGLSLRGNIEEFDYAYQKLEDFAAFAMKCVDCAMCVTVCPQYGVIPRFPYAPKGMFDFVKGVITAKATGLKFDVGNEDIADISGCHKCGLCDGVCPAEIPISSLLRKLSMKVMSDYREEEEVVEIPVFYPEDADAISENSDKLLWVGSLGNMYPDIAKVAVRLLKNKGIKVAIAGTKEKSGFYPVTKGDEKEIKASLSIALEKIRNSGATTVITLFPEDYSVLEQSYKEMSKVLSLPIEFYETVPIEILLLKLYKLQGNGKEIVLHVPCFARTYSREIAEILRNYGYKVKLIEGCSGFHLERTSKLGDRATLLSKALADKYREFITLCPLSEIKFGMVGANVKHFITFLAEEAKVEIKEVGKVEIDKALMDFLNVTLDTALRNVLENHNPEMVDLVVWGINDSWETYRKLVEQIVKPDMEREINEKLIKPLMKMANDKFKEAKVKGDASTFFSYKDTVKELEYNVESLAQDFAEKIKQASGLERADEVKLVIYSMVGSFLKEVKERMEKEMVTLWDSIQNERNE